MYMEANLRPSHNIAAGDAGESLTVRGPDGRGKAALSRGMICAT
jgi:hypothetical protein